MTVAAAPSVVDTGKVTNRRILHFDSIDQVLEEVDRLVAAERAGRLKRVGNWTLGQALGHLATWSEFAYTRMPLNPPFFVRWILWFQRKKYLYGPMRAGVQIPGVKGGTLGTEPMGLDEGFARYKRALARTNAEPPTVPSPVFGPMTQEENIAINLRHAELHLGFFVAE